MAGDGSTAEKKLNMSLDALIAQDRKREMQSKGPSGRDSQGRGRYQQGRGQSSGRGRGHQQGRVGGHYVRTQPGFGSQHMRQETGGGRDQGYFPNEGFRPPGQFVGMGTIMPNFGRPFGVIPPPGMHPLDMAAQMFSHSGFRNGSQMQADVLQPQPPAHPKPAAPAPVPLARLDEETGEVTVSLKGKTVVKVSKTGTITLDANGSRTAILFMALNAVLNIVGVSITRPQNNDEWSISDGRSLTRFRDGVTLTGRGPQSLQRGPKILTAFGGADPNAAAAATQASNAAAAAAGIVLGKKADSQQQKSSKAVLNQIHQQTNGREANPIQQGDGNAPGSGGKSEDADRLRRMKARGRYKPY